MTVLSRTLLFDQEGREGWDGYVKGGKASGKVWVREMIGLVKRCQVAMGLTESIVRIRELGGRRCKCNVN